jgi:riboflavin kinase/FMN adenylyltransferase
MSEQLPPDAAVRLVSGSTLSSVTLPAVLTRRGGMELRACTSRGRDLIDAGGRFVVTIGAFDGVHVGHRQLVHDALDEARSLAQPTAAVTFDPDPDVILGSPRTNQHLLSCPDRVRVLASLGVDVVATVPFDRAMADTPYDDFVRDRLVPVLHPTSLHVGRDFRMGAGGLGTTGALSGLGRTLGFVVRAEELLAMDGSPVSATRVRALLDASDVRSAAALLTRCHFVRGRVVHGRGEGTSFGFPTANVVCDPSLKLPAPGVYAGFVRSGGSAWPAAINVGAPPTFSEGRSSFLEANLIGFEGDLYDLDVQVVFTDFLRPSRRFDSTEELERVVLGNVEWVRERLGDERLEVRS